MSGTANLAGSAVINPINTGFATPGSKEVTILSSAGGTIDSGLDLIFQESAVIEYKLLFPNPTDVVLGTSIDFSPAGLNQNEAAIGEAINAINLAGGSTSFAPVVAEIFKLPELQSLASAYDQLNPNIYDITTATSFNNTLQYMRTLQDRMRGIRESGITSRIGLQSGLMLDNYSSLLAYNGSNASLGQLLETGQHQHPPSRYGVWIDGFGYWRNQSAEPGYTGFDSNMAGISLGLDFLIDEKMIAGISSGYSHTDIDLDNNRGEGDIDSPFVSLYGSYFAKDFYLDTILYYARQRYSNNRNIIFGSIHDAPQSDHTGDAYSAFLGGGYNYKIDQWGLQPYASLQYIYLKESAFDETGADGMNLTVRDRSTDGLYSQLGLRLARRYQFETGSFMPEMKVAWSHDFDIDDRLINSSFSGTPGSAFVFRGQDVSKDAATLGAGITYALTNGLSAAVRYSADLSEDYTNQSVHGEIRYAF